MEQFETFHCYSYRLTSRMRESERRGQINEIICSELLLRPTFVTLEMKRSLQINSIQRAITPRGVASSRPACGNRQQLGKPLKRRPPETRFGQLAGSVLRADDRNFSLVIFYVYRAGGSETFRRHGHLVISCHPRERSRAHPGQSVV